MRRLAWSFVRPIRIGALVASVALPAVLWQGALLAQPCDRSCAPQARDAHGCCPPSTTSVRPAPSRPRTECEDGKTISPDTAGHCCWAGQVWRSERCAGLPTSCPDLRVLAPGPEECVPRVGLDRDGDGIPDERDACPDVPEDMNSFEDADGCPDEQKRLARLAAAEQQRLEAQQIELAARRTEEAERAAKLTRTRIEQDWEQKVASARPRRVAGLVIGGVGLLAGIGSFVFMGLGAGENSSIRSGSFATGSDIASAASSGSTDNTVAIVLGITGLVGCGVGLPLFITGLGTPDKPRLDTPLVSVSPMPRSAGVLTTVHFE